MPPPERGPSAELATSALGPLSGGMPGLGGPGDGGAPGQLGFGPAT